MSFGRRNGFDDGIGTPGLLVPSFGLYAKIGEQVVCLNGHVIAVFARNCYKGERIRGDMFVQKQQGIDWRDGARIYGCALCGQPFTNRGKMHFADGWRE